MKQSLLTGLVVFVIVFGVSSRKVDGGDRFVSNGNGTVTDTQYGRTGLMWAARDNGSDITWADAKRYCENYRGGGYTDWRMPTIDELEVLYDERADGNNGHHLTKLITLTAGCLWSSELDQSSGAELFDFDNGIAPAANRHDSRKMRALPVRYIKK